MSIPKMSIAELELIAARGWQGTSTAQLGEWLLRAGGGFTGRANSVLAVGEPGLPLGEALEVVDGFYIRHQLASQFQLPFADDGRHPLTADLTARGWEIHDRVAFLIADCSALGTNAIRAQDQVADLASVPDQRWLAGYHYRGKPLPDNAIAVLVNTDQPVFASLSKDGKLQGVARGAITDGWLGITAVTVQPEFRRQGVGTALMLELIEWGRNNDARWTYLQVDGQNEPAMSMYRMLGFELHHHYSYARRASQ